MLLFCFFHSYRITRVPIIIILHRHHSHIIIIIHRAAVKYYYYACVHALKNASAAAVKCPTRGSYYCILQHQDPRGRMPLACSGALSVSLKKRCRCRRVTSDGTRRVYLYSIYSETSTKSLILRQRRRRRRHNNEHHNML